MEKSLRKRGYCHVFGDRISLDEGIMPFKFAIERVTDPEKLIPHLFKSTDPDFPNKVKAGDFIIGGQEFACGKPHVQGFIAMAALNMSVICESMPYKAMRRAVSVGLPLLTGCNPGADFVKDGDELEVDFATGVAMNLTRGTSTRLPAMSPILMNIVVNGGINGALAAWLREHPEQAEGEPVVLTGAGGAQAVPVKFSAGEKTMTTPVMIMVAPNGARALKKDNPATPISPKEIAEEVIRCARAGASIAHLHARQEDGQPTQSIDVFREIADRIREHSDIVLQISLGTIGFTVEEAIEPVDLNPEMVSLPLDGFLKDDAAAHEGIRQMALKVREHRVRPELSVYNERMLNGALRLIEEGAIDRPACFGLILRDPESIRQGAAKLMELADALPANSQWWAARGGKYGLGLRALAVEMGGHVRVGFEDSVMDFDQTKLAPSNAYLVERMANLCHALGRPIATAAQARAAVSVA